MGSPQNRVAGILKLLLVEIKNNKIFLNKLDWNKAIKELMLSRSLYICMRSL